MEKNLDFFNTNGMAKYSIPFYFWVERRTKGFISYTILEQAGCKKSNSAYLRLIDNLYIHLLEVCKSC